jgi:hypothetical protein
MDLFSLRIDLRCLTTDIRTVIWAAHHKEAWLHQDEVRRRTN